MGEVVRGGAQRITLGTGCFPVLVADMKKSLFHTGRKRSKKQKAVDQVSDCSLRFREGF